MFNAPYPYDNTDKYSIWEYSKRLLGKTLEEAIGFDLPSDYSGKGRLGQMVEHYFFQYQPNSDPTADFREAGTELKCTPLKMLANKVLQIKERLVCTMIDYSEDPKFSFRESHVYQKCACMLILMYLHQSNVPVQQLKFIYSVLWEIPQKDLLIMEQDYDKIIEKIRSGKAHELSEGDTTYLGACRKGQKGDSEQFYSLPDGTMAAIPAPKRAFSLKTQYMRTILDFIENYGEPAGCNTKGFVKGFQPGLVTEEELQTNTLEDILLQRFNAYLGKSYSELCREFGLEESAAKNKYALIANAILTLNKTRGEDVQESEEFKKSGIKIKTIRLKKSGRPTEAMSFENINYQEILSEDSWYESRLYDLFTSRFLFIVFKDSDASEVPDYRLFKAFFWTMPYNDLKDAEKYWESIRKSVILNKIDSTHFYRESQNLKFHVRPKARNAQDLAVNPHGGLCPKYCYWFNHNYIQNIIEES